MEANPFNSGLESAIRTLTVLAAISPLSADLQRLLMFDYLLVHSADASGPPSLHPSTPLRNGELLVRRSLVEQGLLLLVSRELVDRIAGARGIYYAASEHALPFLDSLSSEYVRGLRDRAYWIESHFMPLSDSALQTFFKEHFDQWTTEFLHEERSVDLL